jgi:hypothetical protein
MAIVHPLAILSRSVTGHASIFTDFVPSVGDFEIANGKVV